MREKKQTSEKLSELKKRTSQLEEMLKARTNQPAILHEKEQNHVTELQRLRTENAHLRNLQKAKSDDHGGMVAVLMEQVHQLICSLIFFKKNIEKE